MPSKREKRERARKQKRREDRAAKEAAAEAAQQAGGASNPGIPHSPASLHGCSHASGCSAGPGSPLPSPDAASDSMTIDTPASSATTSAGAISGDSFLTHVTLTHAHHTPPLALCRSYSRK